VDAIPVAASLWRHADGDFRLLHVNAPGVELTEGRALEQIGMSILDHHPADSPVVSDLRRCIATQSRVTRSGLVGAPSIAGQRHLALTYGFVAPDLVVACAQDLAAEGPGAAHADDTAQRFRAAFERAPIGMALVWLTPEAAGVPFAVNASLCRTLRVDEPELLSHSLFSRCHPDDAEKGIDAIEAVVRGESGSFTVTKRWRRGDGTLVSASCSARPSSGPTRCTASCRSWT
jgi:PAS domain-containing protein